MCIRILLLLSYKLTSRPTPAPKIGFVPDMLLLGELLVAAEILPRLVHVLASTVIRSFHPNQAFEPDLSTSFAACVALVYAAMTIDVEATRTVSIGATLDAVCARTLVL